VKVTYGNVSSYQSWLAGGTHCCKSPLRQDLREVGHLPVYFKPPRIRLVKPKYTDENARRHKTSHISGNKPSYYSKRWLAGESSEVLRVSFTNICKWLRNSDQTNHVKMTDSVTI